MEALTEVTKQKMRMSAAGMKSRRPRAASTYQGIADADTFDSSSFMAVIANVIAVTTDTSSSTTAFPVLLCSCDALRGARARRRLRWIRSPIPADGEKGQPTVRACVRACGPGRGVGGRP